MSAEYVGIGAINDRHISNRISWTREEKNTFFSLLSTHKNNLKHVAKQMNKSYLEIQAYSDYLSSLGKEIGSVNRASIPFALEAPDDFDSLPTLAYPTAPKYKPELERYKRLISRRSTQRIVRYKRWDQFHRETCNKNGIRRGRTRPFARRLLELFVAEVVCYICDNATTNMIRAEQVHAALSGLPITRSGRGVAPLLPQAVSQDQYLNKRPSKQSDHADQDSDSASDEDTLEETDDDDDDEDVPQLLASPTAKRLASIMNQEDQIDKFDVSYSQEWCNKIIQQCKPLEPRKVSREKLLEVRANGQPDAKYEDRICVACGATNFLHFCNGPHDMGWFCFACYLWARSRKTPLSPQEIIKARENRCLSKPPKSCTICAKTGEAEYHEGTPPFKNICRTCASWIMQELDKRVVYVDEIRKVLGHDPRPHRGPRKEYILYPARKSPWNASNHPFRLRGTSIDAPAPAPSAPDFEPAPARAQPASEMAAATSSPPYSSPAPL